MSNDPFFQKDPKVSLGMKCVLAIMRQHFPNGLRADGMNSAAHHLADRLNRPSRLGRSQERRHRVLKDAIGVAKSRGWLVFAGGSLTITDRGMRLLEDRSRRRDRRYGRSMAIAA